MHKTDEPIQEYISPEMAMLALVSMNSSNQDYVGVIFDRIPLVHRLKIKRLCTANFPVQTGRQVKKVSFDKLIFAQPRGVCWGVRVDLESAH